MAETYHRWRLPQLWEMVAADNATDAHLHLATLRRQQTALEAQRDHLRSLRDHLANSWPPSKSEASTAFIDALNDMIDAMTGAARGAGEVRAALAHIVNVIQESRSTLASLVTEYDKVSKVADPRITQHAKSALDQRARDALIAADATVVHALGMLDAPLPIYTRFSAQETIPAAVPGTTQPGDAGNGAMNLTSGGRDALVSLPAPRFEPPMPVPDDEVGLAGSQTGNTPGLAVSGSTSVPAWSAGGEPLTYPVIGSRGGLGVPGPVAEGGSAVRPLGTPMIGGSPPAGSGRAGSAPVAGMRRPAAMTSGHGDQSSDQYAARRRTPQANGEGTWTVLEGVPPVLEAKPPTTHDPGPGVLGIDR
ncbi:hypothetical protein [Dactylosporangium sp. NPDC050588]|uniref:hypothetical protein n=1 Tax=Dactylosporangium sp. NPDC050588 TaxID=3157211 RepID=UPI0033FD4E0D